MTDPFSGFAPAVQEVARSLEVRARNLKPRHDLIQKVTKELCNEVGEIYREFEMTGGTGFFGWMERQSGLSRSTIYRYLNAWRAIKDGLDPDGTAGVMELADKGNAIRLGVPAKNLKGDITPEEVQKLVESRMHEGTVAIYVPESGKEDVDVVVDHIKDAWAKDHDGEVIEKPEAIGQAFRILRKGMEGE